jgi:hypothetical protein
VGGDVDDEGDGDAVREGEPEPDGLGDFDGWDEGDVEREGAVWVAWPCAAREPVVWAAAA